MALAARQALAAFTDQRVVALRETQNEFVCVRSACGSDDLGAGRTRFAVSDVVGDGAEKQKRFLQHQTDVAAVIGDAYIADINTIYANGTFAQVVKAADQIDHGAFAGATLADQPDHFAGRDVQRQTFDDGAVAVPETGISDLYAPDHFIQSHGFDRLGHAGHMVQDFKNALGACRCFLRVRHDSAHGIQACIKTRAVRQKRGQHTDRDLMIRHLPNAESPDHQQTEFGDQRDRGRKQRP